MTTWRSAWASSINLSIFINWISRPQPCPTRNLSPKSSPPRGFFSRQPSAKSRVFLVVKNSNRKNFARKFERTNFCAQPEGISSSGNARRGGSFFSLSADVFDYQSVGQNVHGQPIKALRCLIVTLPVYFQFRKPKPRNFISKNNGDGDSWAQSWNSIPEARRAFQVNSKGNRRLMRLLRWVHDLETSRWVDDLRFLLIKTKFNEPHEMEMRCSTTVAHQMRGEMKTKEN